MYDAHELLFNKIEPYKPNLIQAHKAFPFFLMQALVMAAEIDLTLLANRT